jgi:lysophospholipase L1-like esterase
MRAIRRFLCCVSVLVLCALAAVPASASSEGHGYLALGDSVAFGTNPLLDSSKASNFTGYPEIVAQTLNIEDVNAACPGEASGGFISPTGLDNVCRPYRATSPLHVAYSGTQLDFAINYLKNNPRTRLVTLNLGANDIFRLQKNCNFDPACIGANLPIYLANLDANLRTIFAALRGTGYTGLIVALTYYALDYNDTSGAILLNNPMIEAASHYGVLIASGLEAWKADAVAAGGSSCAAGLLIPRPKGGCDVHPTPKGRDLLAAAIVGTIAGSCPAGATGSPIGCLDRHRA